MQRSQINAILRDVDAFVRARQFYLPPFAYWSPQDWTTRGDAAREIVDRKLGWDITDFGRGDYAHYGLALFTLRNGDPEALATGTGKLYAEKVLIIAVDQANPLHFHWRKTEDIINRGGGDLVLELYGATDDDKLSADDVVVSTDGVRRSVRAGGRVILRPGESITIPPRLYHRFWADGGRVLAGEVSLVNDDQTDNRFYRPDGRFPTVEEDEPPLYLLCSDYPRFIQ